MKKRSLQLFILIISLAVSALAQINLDEPIPRDPSVRVGKLENGLTYYIKRNTKPEKKVELRLVVNVGSVLEREDQLGLAHFLEHMAFNGTTNFEKNELISYLQSIGVQFGLHLNAYTSFDETVYMLSIPTEKKELLDKGLLVLSDWAGGMTLDPKEIDKERGVVLEEYRLSRSAQQRMQERYFPKLFKGSRYAERLPIGTEKNLQTFKHQSLRDFYEDWYRPDLMAVVAVGDLNVDEMENKIRAKFSSLKTKRVISKRTVYGVPDHSETLIAIEKDKEVPFTRAQIIIKRDKVETKTLGDLRKDLVMSFFSAMLNARISEIQQSPESPFIFAWSGFDNLVREKGSYSVGASAKPKKIKESIELLLKENKRVKKFGFNKSELDRQKKAYEAGLKNRYEERDKTESFILTGSYVYNFLSGYQMAGIEFEYEFAKKVLPTITVKEVNALAEDTIKKENRVLIITGPNKPGVKYPSESDISRILRESENVAVSPYVDNVSSEPLVAELETEVKIENTSFDKKHGITHWKLSNGINVWLKPTDFKKDEILMEGFSPGGSSVLPDHKALQAANADAVAGKSGLGKFSRIELNKKLTGKYAAASAGYSELYENVSGSSTPKDFETMLQLLYLRFTNVNFSQKILDAYRNQQKAFYDNLFSDPFTYFFTKIEEIEAQKHPRFVNPFDASQYDKLKLEEIKMIYKDRFADASDYNFIFVGSIDLERHKPIILKYLGNLPITNRKENWKVVGPDFMKGPFKKVIYKGQAPKSLVTISMRGKVKYNRRDDFLISSMSKLLSNKLTEILREEKSGVYGVGASASMSRIPRQRVSLMITFPCGPENVKSLTGAALSELKKLQNGEIKQKDVDKIVEAEIVELREGLKTNYIWIDLIQDMLKNNVPIMTKKEFEARAKSITIAEIQRVAKSYFDIDKRVEFVLMPESYKPKAK